VAGRPNQSLWVAAKQEEAVVQQVRALLVHKY